MFPFWMELTLGELESCLGLMTAAGVYGMNLFGSLR